MFRRYRASATLTFLLIFTGAISASAQITIDADDLLGHVGSSAAMATYETYDVAGLEAILAAEGENQVYDFSSLTFSDTLQSMVHVYGSGEDQPAGWEFPSANYVIEYQPNLAAAEDSAAWIYNYVHTDSIVTLGGAYVYVDPDTQEPDTVALKYEPPMFNNPLPVTYGDSWTAEYEFFGFPTTDEGEIEGWGTLILPGGEEIPVLRMRQVSTQNVLGFESVTSEVIFMSASPFISAVIYLDDDLTTPVMADVTGTSEATAAEADEVPHAVQLSQNYPNPFNPSTSLEFALGTADHVTLAVHDMLGRQVALLQDGVLPAGQHRVTFDASGLSSGTYIYRLRTSERTITRVMTLAK